MAKKEKLTTDRISLDADLNFDDFFLDDIDAGMSKESKDKKKRSPVLDVFKGSIGGIKDKFKDPGFLARVTRDVLPKQYGEAIDVTDGVIGSMASLYNDAIKDVKPQFSRLAKQVDQLVPDEKKFFKKISGKFKDLAGDESSSFRGQSKESISEQSISNSLAGIFSSQNEANEDAQARAAADGKIKQAIENRQFQSNFGLLSSINDSVQRLSNYNQKVTQAYQKKSIELQFRSYFVQSELLQTSSRFFEVFKNQNEAIVKNTGLPEFVKIKDSEHFIKNAKGKFYDAIQTSLFGDSELVKKAATKFKGQAKQFISGIKSGLEQSISGLEGLASINEQNQSLEEAGGESLSKAEMAGGMVGDAIGGKVGSMASGAINKAIPADSPLGRTGYKLAGAANNLHGKISDAKQSSFIRDNYYEDGLKGHAAKAASWALGMFDTNIDKNIKGSSGIKGLSEPAIYNDKTQRSITEVIPGYLARIYRELIVTRTNDTNVGMVRFDYTSGKFIKQKDIAADIKQTLSNRIKNSSHGFAINKATRNLVGDTELTDDQSKSVKQFVNGLSGITMDYTPEKIKDTELFKALDPDTAKIISDSLDRNITDANENERGQYNLTRDIGVVRNATPDIRGELELFIKAGYGDILEKQGLVTRKRDGSFEMNIEAYQRMLHDEDIVSSDVNVKRNIKRFKPNDALNAIKKTRIYDWLYKTGKGDQRPHTGPMAQDVNANMGEDAAPDGTKIDLTTMNGINMSAIQALQHNQEKIATHDNGNSVLTDIKKDTAAIVEILSNGSHGGVSSGYSFGGLKGKIGKASKTIFDVIDSSFTMGKNNIAKPLASIIASSYKNNKDGVSDILKSLFGKAGEMALKVMDIGRDIITDKLPAGFKQLAAISSKARTAIFKLLEGPIDVYVRGRSIPALKANLMKMGYYIDQASGKVIESIKDIKGPVINRLGELVLSADDANELVDKDGREIDTPFAKIAKFAISSAIKGAGRIKNAFSGLFNIGSGIGSGPLDKIRSLFSSSNELGGGKTYDILVEIRDILRSRLGDFDINSSNRDSDDVSNVSSDVSPDLTHRYTSGRSSFSLGSLLNKGRSAINGFKSGSGGILNKLKSAAGGLMSSDEDGVSEHISISDRIKQGKDLLKEKGKAKLSSIKDTVGIGKAAWNDRDSSGKRDGAWQDRLAEQAQRKKDRTKDAPKADLALRYKSDKNVLDGMFDKVSSFIGMLSGGAGGLFSKASGIFSAVTGFLGLGGKGGMLGGLLKGALGIIKSPGKLLTTAASIGRPLVAGISAIKNVSSIARIASAANAVKNVALVGSLLTAGTGSAILGVAGAALSGIAAILGSPVILGAAAIAAVGYGAYKAYKYFTRDNANDYEKIRLAQYGITDSTNSHIHEVLKLEQYLIEDKIGYSGGEAYIIHKNIDMEELLAIFSIDKDDTKMVTNFTEWFQGRFKPFFLTHLTALFSVNSKVKLEDVKDLKPEERVRYLGLISFESGPYNGSASPFKDTDSLTNGKDEALAIIKRLTSVDSALIKRTKSTNKDTTIDKPVSTKPQDKPKDLPKIAIPPTKNRNPTLEMPSGEDGNVNQSSSKSAAKEADRRIGQVNEAGGPMSNGDSAMQYAKLQPGVNLAGINPTLLKNFKSMIQEYGESTGKSVIITSGLRSKEQQEALYKKDPSKAAKPGRSLHEFGLAIDVNSADLDALDKIGLMRKYGFTRPVGGEPWHTEAAGIQTNIQQAKNDPNFADQAIEASIFKGGGGAGTISDMRKGQRDNALALKLMDISSPNIVKNDKDKVTDLVSKPKSGPTYTDEDFQQTADPTTDQQKSGEEYGYTSPSDDDSNRSSGQTMAGLSSSGGYGGSIVATQNSAERNIFPDGESKPSNSGASAKGNINPSDKEGIKKEIASLSRKAGVDPTLMTAFAAVESSLNPNAGAGTSSAKGLFQFVDRTWKEQLAKFGNKYNIDPTTGPTDISASTLLAAEYVKSNVKGLKSVKPDANLTDVYLSHLLGPTGAKRILSSSPDKIAAKVRPDAAASNKPLFYSSGRPLTVSQFYDGLSNKLTKTASDFNIDLDSNSFGKAGNDDSSNSNESDFSDGGALANESTVPEGKGGPANSVDSASKITSTASSSLGDSGGVQMPAPKATTVGFVQPNSISSSQSVPLDSGQGFGLNNLSTGINTVNDTLTKSLSVLEQILEAIKGSGSNINPDNITSIRDNLLKVADQTNKPSVIPASAIDLTRKSA